MYIEKTEILSWQQYVDRFKTDPELTATAPVVNGPGFIEKGNSLISVFIKGMTFPDGEKIYKLKKNLVRGNLAVTGETALIGKTVADKLRLSPGDKFFLRNNSGEQTFLLVGGIFDLGADAGNNLVILSLDRARSFLHVDGVSSIELQAEDVFKAESIAARYTKEFTRVKCESWQEKNRQLLVALQSQSSSSNTIQFFVILSISLGIASILGIAAIQKSRQLGILKAMGTTNKSAAYIFIIQGFLLGLVSSVVGIIVGLGLGIIFMQLTGAEARFGLELSLTNILLPVLLAIICSTIAAAVPARRASRISPIEVIRNG
jgi:lipoprotein-releasing system permease protein